MAKFTLNKYALKQTLSDQRAKLQPILDDNIIPILEGEKENVLDDIKRHPVSEDITKPETVGHYSLFGLIGFEEGTDPVGDLVSVVDENIGIPVKSSSVTVVSDEYVRAKYTIIIPDEKDYDDERLSVPWLQGMNFVRFIEKGISGFNKFLRGTRFSTSRSGRGIQSKYLVRDEDYPARPYMSEIIGNFINRLRRRVEGSVLTRLYYNVRDLKGRFRKL